MSAHFLRFAWYLKKAFDGTLGFPAVLLHCVAWCFSDFDDLPPARSKKFLLQIAPL
jgi:hypothetical protein